MNNKENWQNFITLIETSVKKGNLAELCQYIFTPEEREQLATRVSLTKALLQAELSQREIAEQFSVSISKITRGSNALKMIDDKLKQFLTKNI
jgi:TrpR family trp operon transcriptional repressor